MGGVKEPNFYLDLTTSVQDQTITTKIGQHRMWIVDTAEAQVRAALIELGWTPPPADHKP